MSRIPFDVVAQARLHNHGVNRDIGAVCGAGSGPTVQLAAILGKRSR